MVILLSAPLPVVTAQTYNSLILYHDNVQALELRLLGVGIHPQIDLSLGSGKDLCLDMGHALAKDVLSKTFTLLNSSPINVRYHLSMETQLHKRGGAITKNFRESSKASYAVAPSHGYVCAPFLVQRLDCSWASLCQTPPYRETEYYDFIASYPRPRTYLHGTSMNLSITSENNLSSIQRTKLLSVSRRFYCRQQAPPPVAKCYLRPCTNALMSTSDPMLGACNYSGQPPFVCVPSEGVVAGEGSKEVRVFFSPDHQSKAYSDKLLVDYNEKVSEKRC